jgi:hypothetical protein
MIAQLSGFLLALVYRETFNDGSRHPAGMALRDGGYRAADICGEQNKQVKLTWSMGQDLLDLDLDTSMSTISAD